MRTDGEREEEWEARERVANIVDITVEHHPTAFGAIVFGNWPSIRNSGQDKSP